MMIGSEVLKGIAPLRPHPPGENVIFMVYMGKDAYTQIIIYQYLRKDKEKDKYIAANKTKGQLWLGKFNVFVFVLGLDFVFVFACMLINTDLSEGIIANIHHI